MAALLMFASAVQAADGPAERQSVEELRNTVVNLLQALVDKGLLTREQAQALVKQAQDKAAADAATQAARDAAQAKEEEGAVRVPYVPQIVKDEISKQVAEEVKPAVIKDVVQEAKSEKWGVPGALPEWLSGVSVFGDVTFRGQADLFPHDNSYQELLDINAVNAAGGIAKATYPFLDTTEDRYRMRVRARLGVKADLSDHVEAVIRLASGSLTQIAGSESQTLGTYGNRYAVGIDEAYIVWNTNLRDLLSMNSLAGGRLGNPWFSPTELVYARDLTFEGVADTLRLGWGVGGPDKSHVFLTAGAFPMLEVPEQASQDKWMLGAQLGTHLRFNDGSDHLQLAGAYYDFLKVTGEQNQPFSTLLNYTATPFVQWGNTVFDILNTTDTTSNLFALAAHFRVADIAASYDHSFGSYSAMISAEATRNLGYNLATIEALSGQAFSSSQDKGYVGEVSFGDPTVDAFGRWRAAIGYRYVQADAVLDAWTDADFHGGGTNADGYYFWGSMGLTHNTWVRLRYLSANEIVGPRYGLDIWQLDFNARF
jgi:NAD(P)-dependent dehydrogenase (short-subunit alcohol dehydrogenase family)